MSPPRATEGLKPLLAERDAGEGGHLVGRDPRSVFMATWDEAGTPRRTLAEAVRAKCLDCCGDQPGEVRRCMALGCPLWPFRMGTDPFHGRRPRPRGNPPPAPDFEPGAVVPGPSAAAVAGAGNRAPALDGKPRGTAPGPFATAAGAADYIGSGERRIELGVERDG